MHRKLKCIHTYRKEREIGRRLNLKIMITNIFVSIRYKVLKIFIEINEIMIFQINQIYFLSHLY